MTTETFVVTALARTILVLVFICASAFLARPQSGGAKPEASPTPDEPGSLFHTTAQPELPKADRDPIEKADEYKSKLTFGVYFTAGNQVYDLNLRHQLGPFTVWIAGFMIPKTISSCAPVSSTTTRGPGFISSQPWKSRRPER